MPSAGHRGHREWGDTMRGKHREWETQPARPSLRPGLEALKRPGLPFLHLSSGDTHWHLPRTVSPLPTNEFCSESVFICSIRIKLDKASLGAQQTQLAVCGVLSPCSRVRPVVTLCTGARCPWDSLGRNTGVGCHARLRGIFPSQGSNL